MSLPFWSRVDSSGECWVWTGALDKDGYGVCHQRFGSRKAHRAAVILSTGKPIPDGLVVDHTCFTRSCVRPDHLRVVDRSVNAALTSRSLKTHCKRGHERNAENIRVEANGQWKCRPCDALRKRQASQQKEVA